MRKLLFILLLYFIYCPFILNAQDYYFNHLDINSGLSQNTVMYIHQDAKGFMWFGTKNGLNRFDGSSFKIFYRGNSPGSLRNGTISYISEDQNGILWIGTDKGISLYNPQTESFSDFNKVTDKGEHIDEYIRKIEIDHDNNVWILTSTLLAKYNPSTDELMSMTPILQAFSKELPNSISVDDDGIAWVSLFNYGILRYDIKKNKCAPFYLNPLIKISLNQDFKNNYLLIGTENHGLLKLSKRDGNIENIILDPSKSDQFVRSVRMLSENELWIGTESGVYVYTPNEVKHITHNIYDNYSLADNAVYSVYTDKEGGIWIGTYFGGVDYIPNRSSLFEKFYPSSQPYSISGERVREFCEDPSGNLWIATEDAGLNHYDIKTRRFSQISSHTTPLAISYHNIQCLNLHGNELWIGFFSKGIDVINLQNQTKRHYEKTGLEFSLDNNDIFCIYTDNTGQTWIGTSTGVLQYDREKDHFVRLNQFGAAFISDITEDKTGNLWFSTYNGGAIRYNPRKKELKNFNYDKNDSTSIAYHKISSIFKDSNERLWFCSEDGGFCLFDNSTETFKRITTEDGLPSNVIYKIVEDDNHKFWISTNNGLAEYDPDNGDVKVFTRSNGLLTNQFNYKSGIKAKDNKIYFGSINGLIAFEPQTFKEDNSTPNVVLTGFQVFNQEVAVGPDSPLKQSITFTKEIELNYRQSSFSFDFVALSYGLSQANKYLYKLEGLDKNWIHLDRKARVAYSNITPGNYVFRIKALGNDGKWSNKETSVSIRITPPFWQTPIAYFFYIIIISGAIYWIIRYNIKRINKRNRYRQETFENKKKEEIYNAKIDFFTNIAHEIRTPLSLIKAPLDHILNDNVDQQEMNDDLNVMERNVNRLLDLINQLLDFREVESNVFQLSMQKIDINKLVEDTYIRFAPIAKQQKLAIHLEMPEVPIITVADKEALTKICSNLFNNAVKYADSYINISLSLMPDTKHLQLKVNNDGTRIPSEFKDKIFEAFFQLKDTDKAKKSGSGIGLALVRSLIHMHQGKIYLDDQSEDICFVIELPIHTKENGEETQTEKNSEVKNTENEQQLEESFYGEKYSILVVEDHKDLQDFLADKLGKHYHISVADNGVEALKIMNEKVINLVVSDVVMPLMDGFELCKAIKSNIETSHIPVILLTAKTNLGSKIEGLKKGADAYIEKPFSTHYLLAQISNLFESRDNLRKNFSNNPLITTNSIVQTKADEKFMNKLTEAVVNNIDVEEFNVDNLAEIMCMSRTSLHRKIKGISDMTPGDFIRIVRLKKAAELLQEGEYRINEIAILVGFQSQSYFAKSFQKQFGVLPKDFIKKNTSNE